MKNTLFFFRTYIYDFLTAIFAAILYFVSFRFDPRMTLILSLIITILSFSLIVYLRLKEKDFYFTALTKREDKDDWLGRGTFEYRRASRAYLIANSEAGYIFSKTLYWSDYKYEFEFKILNSCLGAVVRAANLSDYVMFQIRLEGIRPHIRINGGWRPWEAKETGLVFKDELSRDNWYKCTLTCEKDLIDIKIEKADEIIIERSWNISHERLGFPFPQLENDPKPITIHFPIDLDYGSVGFRNTGGEKALVKNVLIEKL